MISKQKLIRITTVPMSLDKLLEGQLSFMSDYYDVVAVSSQEKELKLVAQKQEVPYYHLELTRKITPLKDLIALFRLYRFFRREKPDIVHTHTPKAGIIGMLASFLAGVPIRLHTVAGLPLMETSGLKFKLLITVEKLTYACATMVYPNSFGLKDYIIEHNLTSTSKLKVIGNGSSNGIDTTYFSLNSVRNEEINRIREEYDIVDSDRVLLFVGRVVKDKGVDELIKSFLSVAKVQKNLKLVIVGPLEQELNPISPQSMNQLKNNPKIVHTGYQSDVRPFFAIATLFVFPSYREGFPNVVMQAGAMGIPAIVSDINGCNEIIKDGINGFVIPAKNISKLEKAIYDLLNDQVKLNQMKDLSRQIIINSYERSYIINELLKEYQNTIQK